jgi:hypothetical protein
LLLLLICVPTEALRHRHLFILPSSKQLWLNPPVWPKVATEWSALPFRIQETARSICGRLARFFTSMTGPAERKT